MNTVAVVSGTWELLYEFQVIFSFVPIKMPFLKHFWDFFFEVVFRAGYR